MFMSIQIQFSGSGIFAFISEMDYLHHFHCLIGNSSVSMIHFARHNDGFDQPSLRGGQIISDTKLD